MKANFGLKKLSLPAKLTLGFFLVGVLTISMTAVSMFLISRNNLHGEIRKQLQNYVQLAALHPALALRAEPLGKAEFLQDRRVELVRQRVDVVAELHEPLTHGSQRACLDLVGS